MTAMHAPHRFALLVTATALVAGAALVGSFSGTGAAAGPGASFSWQLRPTGTASGLRGLAAVDENTAWVSGGGGTVLRTTDGGVTWQNVAPPDAAGQAFRDIEAFTRDHVVLLAIGPGDASRVYVTEDGGETWTKTAQNTEPLGFWDCMSFFDRHRGLIMGDPVGGKFQILATEDGGRSWTLLPSDGMPAALPGEFGFAASGTCIETAGGRDAWFGTGGDVVSRVFHSADRGRTWSVVETSVASAPAGGIFSLAFADPRHGIAVGGDFLDPANAPDGAAYTVDGGVTWHPADGPGEYRSGSHWIPRLPWTAVAVGPTGSDVTTDGGRTWTRFDSRSFDSVECASTGGCWASGAQGVAARLVVDR